MTRLKVIFSWIWAFIMPFVIQLGTAIGPILAKAAMDAVKLAADQSAMSNNEKREYAYWLIAEELKTSSIVAGRDIATSMINAAIEMAVVKMKGAAGGK